MLEGRHLGALRLPFSRIRSFRVAQGDMSERASLIRENHSVWVCLLEQLTSLCRPLLSYKTFVLCRWCRSSPIGRKEPTGDNQGVSSGNVAIRFGQRLRRVREKAGLSQVEMAYKFGIDRGHISELENGKRKICLALLDTLADGFEITISELMKGV